MYESVRYHLEQVKYQIDQNLINWTQIDQVFEDLSPQQIVRCCDYFIKYLEPNHSVSGSDYNQLLGIAKWIRDNAAATRKQRRWLAVAMAAYWDQLQSQARI